MLKNNWDNKVVLITGVCGTVGKEILNRLTCESARRVIGIDNNESDLFFLSEQYRHDDRVQLYLGDLRDPSTLKERMRNVDIVLHAAALKHVSLCEYSPRDAVMTNIVGTQNIIDAATACGVERVLFTSTDKAVNPTTVMGTSKLMAERLMTAANAHCRNGSGPIFASTRFGNVLGSRGSVIPLFKRQIAAGGPVTLTSKEMTRFIMTLNDAVGLVLDSVFMARGGEVFVTKMPVTNILDLAEVMIEELVPKHGDDINHIKLEEVGTRPGEKLYEDLMNKEEARRACETKRFFIVLPALDTDQDRVERTYPNLVRETIDHPYNSKEDRSMSREELRQYLREKQLLELE